MSNDTITLDSLLASMSDDDIGGHDKVASVKPAEVAVPAVASTPSIAEELEGLLTKSASETETKSGESLMNTQDLGNSIAAQIMTKLAADQTNKVVEQTDELVAQQNNATETTPVDGMTVSETAREILRRGVRDGGYADMGEADAELGEGGVATLSSDDYDVSTRSGGAQEAAPQVNDGSGIHKQASEDCLEKIAAVASLMDEEGLTFDDACYLVKEAEEMIASEELEQVKIASINALVAEGVDIESAVAATSIAIAELAGY